MSVEQTPAFLADVQRHRGEKQHGTGMHEIVSDYF